MSFSRFFASSLSLLAIFALAVLGIASLTPASAQSLRFTPPIFRVDAADGTNFANNLLSGPTGVATDRAGNLYIADTNNRVVKKVSPTQTVSIYAGNGGFGYTGDGGPAASATLSHPSSVAVDPAGNLYISDPGNFAVRKVDAVTGIMTTFAGGNGTGSSGDNGPATSAQLVPAGIAADSLGNIYIVDTAGKTVRRVSTGHIISTFAGGGFHAASLENGGPATDAVFNSPWSIAIDASNNVYIGDSAYFIVSKVNASDNTINVFAGTSFLSGATGDGGPATSAKIGLPYGIAVDPTGIVYIATGSATIRAVSTANVISTIVGTGSNNLVFDGTPADRASIYTPQAVAADTFGNLYLATPGNNNVYVVNLHPELFPQTRIGSSSQPQTLLLENAGPASIKLSSFTFGTDFQLAAPVLQSSNSCQQTTNITSGFSGWCAFTVVFTPTAEGIRSMPLTVNSNDTPGVLIQTLTSTGLGSALAMSSGQLFNVAGKFSPNQTSDGPTTVGLATSIHLTQPGGLVVDSTGNLYFSEYGYCLVEKVDANTGIMSIIGGTNTITCGVNDGHTVISGDGGNATAAYMPSVTSMALDANNNLYIADPYDGRIRKIDTTGKISSFAGTGIGLGFNASCHYTVDGGQANVAQLCGPANMTFDAAGNLYFLEIGTSLVRKISTAGVLSTVAGSFNPGTSSFYVGGFSGDGGLATLAQLNQPNGIAVDAAGNIYISDTQNHVIRKVTAATGKISTIAGQHGVQNYTGDGGLATAATLEFPKGLTIDAAGDLFIADYQNWVIRKIDPSGIITTVAGNNLSEFYNGDGLPATESNLSFPSDVFVAPSGYLFINDLDHALIREMSPNGALIFAPQKLNTTSTAQSVTLSNIGNLPLHFAAQFPTGITGDFALASGGTCNFTAALAVGASCNVNITFTPTAFGARSGIFGFFDDGVASPQYVALSGTGQQAQAQRIRINAIPNHVYGDADFTVTGAADSGLPVIFSVKSGNATITGSLVHITGVGPVVIAANQAGATDQWLPALEATTGFTITPAHLFVNAYAATSTQQIPLAALTYYFGGFVYNETAAVLGGVPSISTTATPTSTPGYYPITTGIGTITDPNYTYTFNANSYYLGPYTVPAPAVKLTATSTISHSDFYSVTVTVTNTGTTTAQNVILTAVKLNAIAGTPTPHAMGNIAPGASASFSVAVPNTAGPSGNAIVEQITGTYTGGTFGGSIRATLP